MSYKLTVIKGNRAYYKCNDSVVSFEITEYTNVLDVMPLRWLKSEKDFRKE